MDKEGKKLETIPAWQPSKEKVILGAQRDKKKSPLLVHRCTSVISKLGRVEPQLHKYNGRIVLRGDIAKDDSSACAVITEQGSSAFRMTTAKAMDVIAGLPDFDGQAADAVSAYIQVKLEDAPRLLRYIAQIMDEHRRSSGSS